MRLAQPLSVLVVTYNIISIFISSFEQCDLFFSKRAIVIGCRAINKARIKVDWRKNSPSGAIQRDERKPCYSAECLRFLFRWRQCISVHWIHSSHSEPSCDVGYRHALHPGIFKELKHHDDLAWMLCHILVTLFSPCNF